MISLRNDTHRCHACIIRAIMISIMFVPYRCGSWCPHPSLVGAAPFFFILFYMYSYCWTKYGMLRSAALFDWLVHTTCCTQQQQQQLPESCCSTTSDVCRMVEILDKCVGWGRIPYPVSRVILSSIRASTALDCIPVLARSAALLLNSCQQCIDITWYILRTTYAQPRRGRKPPFPPARLFSVLHYSSRRSKILIPVPEHRWYWYCSFRTYVWYVSPQIFLSSFNTIVFDVQQQ